MQNENLTHDDPPADALLAAETQRVYERHAARFDAERSKGLQERTWLDRFLNIVRPAGRILDLGCGAADPIADYMIGRGFDVTGADASEGMLAIARRRHPDGDWRRVDMRELDLPDRFDGIISWNAFFHLTPGEQRDVLRRIGQHMNAGAALMLTVGPEEGEVVGRVGGDPVYHASLAPAEYEVLLRSMGIQILEFVVEDPSCDFQTVLLGRMVEE